MAAFIIIVILLLFVLWLIASKLFALPAANLIKKIVNMFNKGGS